jgi:hypothetical protein
MSTPPLPRGPTHIKLRDARQGAASLPSLRAGLGIAPRRSGRRSDRGSSRRDGPRYARVARDRARADRERWRRRGDRQPRCLHSDNLGEPAPSSLRARARLPRTIVARQPPAVPWRSVPGRESAPPQAAPRRAPAAQPPSPFDPRGGARSDGGSHRRAPHADAGEHGAPAVARDEHHVRRIGPPPTPPPPRRSRRLRATDALSKVVQRRSELRLRGEASFHARLTCESLGWTSTERAGQASGSRSLPQGEATARRLACDALGRRPLRASPMGEWDARSDARARAWWSSCQVGKARPGRSGANPSDDQALIGSVVLAIWAIDVSG